MAHWEENLLWMAWGCPMLLGLSIHPRNPGLHVNVYSVTLPILPNYVMLVCLFVFLSLEYSETNAKPNWILEDFRSRPGSWSLGAWLWPNCGPRSSAECESGYWPHHKPTTFAVYAGMESWRVSHHGPPVRMLWFSPPLFPFQTPLNPDSLSDYLWSQSNIMNPTLWTCSRSPRNKFQRTDLPNSIVKQSGIFWNVF